MRKDLLPAIYAPAAECYPPSPPAGGIFLFRP